MLCRAACDGHTRGFLWLISITEGETQHEVTIPQIGLIAGTRAMLGAGIALLLSEKLSCEQRTSRRGKAVRCAGRGKADGVSGTRKSGPYLARSLREA